MFILAKHDTKTKIKHNPLLDTNAQPEYTKLAMMMIISNHHDDDNDDNDDDHDDDHHNDYDDDDHDDDGLSQG